MKLLRKLLGMERPTKKKQQEPQEFDEPSEEFERAFGGSGSLVVDCTFCGRTHFANGASTIGYEEGELEALLEKEKATPDEYTSWDYDMISWGFLAGQQWVHGCPCSALKVRRYENFIWAHRREIAMYLEKRSAAQSAQAKLDGEIAATAGSALEEARA